MRLSSNFKSIAAWMKESNFSQVSSTRLCSTLGSWFAGWLLGWLDGWSFGGPVFYLLSLCVGELVHRDQLSYPSANQVDWLVNTVFPLMQWASDNEQLVSRLRQYLKAAGDDTGKTVAALHCVVSCIVPCFSLSWWMTAAQRQIQSLCQSNRRGEARCQG